MPMEQSSEADVYPKFFEFIERDQAGLPPYEFRDKSGVLLAREGLLRAAGHFPGSKRPKGWREAKEGFARRTDDRKYTLKVEEQDGYWLVMRRAGRSVRDLEYLALAFDEVPLITRTDEEAMRLAEHCYPDPGLTVAGLWVPYFSSERARICRTRPVWR
jgi:hypothetical protein